MPGRMEYTLDESKRILIIEKEGKGGGQGGLRPETGGGATNTPGEGEEGEPGTGADRSGLEGLCSEKLVDLVFILATKLDRNVDDMRAQLQENSAATDEKIHVLEENVAEQVLSRKFVYLLVMVDFPLKTRPQCAAIRRRSQERKDWLCRRA